MEKEKRCDQIDIKSIRIQIREIDQEQRVWVRTLNNDFELTEAELVETISAP